MNKENKSRERRVIEWPVFTENHWYTIAIALVIVGVCVATFAAFWVSEAPNLQEMKQRTEIITPFGTLFLALVTFSTVAWRGMVNSRQADQQKRQNDANDTANFAKILQEGAKLLGENEKTQVLAGIASLSIVLTEDQHRFSIEAMDLLADYVSENYQASLNSRLKAAIRTLGEGPDLGFISRVDGVFKCDPGTRRRWIFVDGFKRLQYSGGIFRKAAFELLEETSSFVKLIDVRIESCLFEGSVDCENCIFVESVIREIYDYELLENRFIKCNFSGAKILKGGASASISDLRQTMNYYFADNPPTGSKASEWLPMLHCFADKREAKNYFSMHDTDI